MPTGFPLRMPACPTCNTVVAYSAVTPHPNAQEVVDFGEFANYGEFLQWAWNIHPGDCQDYDITGTPTIYGNADNSIIDSTDPFNGRNTLRQTNQNRHTSLEHAVRRCSDTIWRRTIVKVALFNVGMTAKFYINGLGFGCAGLGGLNRSVEPVFRWGFDDPGTSGEWQEDASQSNATPYVAMAKTAVADGAFHVLTERLVWPNGGGNAVYTGWWDATVVYNFTTDEPPSQRTPLIADAIYSFDYSIFHFMINGTAGSNMTVAFSELVPCVSPYSGLNTP